MAREVVLSVAGHSTRIGTAQDIVASGGTIFEAAQAGGWKSEQQVLAYSRRLLPQHGAVARLWGDAPARPAAAEHITHTPVTAALPSRRGR